ncbi:MAG: sigma-54-dependent Fis family transcriptional regulator [Alphaproteobacteria bacterium]|nr:MAG: sigma-54-dependent Fis family transcriptional regulator [Alphaproteobacteria bacterium]
MTTAPQTVSPTVLIIEDDPTLGPALAQRLRLEGFHPRLAATGKAALADASQSPPDAVISDIRLPDLSGEEVFRALTRHIGLVPVFFMTAFGEVSQAVRLIKAGGRDYLIKPVDIDRLVEMLTAALPALSAGPAAPTTPSPAMAAFDTLLTKAARSDLPLLIMGETGVGKERAARLAHDRSLRAKQPFVALNCAAIPRDLAESLLFGHEKGAFTGASSRKDGVCAEVGDGTLLLDEVAELPLDLQPKLLRLIQERQFRPLGATRDQAFRGRIIAATLRNLDDLVAAGQFREDLFFRLAVIPLTVPPLRERPGEIPVLARQFLAEASERMGRAPQLSLSPEAEIALAHYAWPGNVRELRNRVDRAAALSEGCVIEPSDLFADTPVGKPQEPSSADRLEHVAEAAIRAKVLDTLRAVGGNQSEAARILGASRTTIWKYARKDAKPDDHG